jgi:diguanylate cyclase (GGDEF)-like protein
MPHDLPRVGILIVDDRPENLLALEAVLSPLGQNVVRARSGREALAAAEREQFAVVLMDVRMPGMDGFETLAALRSREESRHVPVILFSADAASHNVARSYLEGAVDFIPKPIDRDLVLSKVSVFVHLRQNELALQRAQFELEQRVAERTVELSKANDALAREIVERKAVERMLLDKTLRDELTGLANRALLMTHLGRAIARSRRRPESFAVLMLDVDRFKSINDGLGHLAGDHILVGIAQRLLQCVRTVDTVARLGGDEFAILLDGIQDVRGATRLAERIQKAVRAPFMFDGKAVPASVSIGIAMMNPTYERSEDVLRDADSAMYRAKSAGRGEYRVFDVAMYARAMARIETESELRLALERDELKLEYQPIIGLSARSIIGFEALVRWHHPQRGLVGPAGFIPVAEETGLICPLGAWVFKTACAQLAAWQSGGLPELTLAVNLSKRELAQPELPDLLHRVVEESHLETRAVQLELPETVAMAASGVGADNLARLSSIGFPIVLDDFGVGHSCVSRFRRLPVSGVKIDRSLVGALEDEEVAREVVETIVLLAHRLGARVVAKGVETKEQAERVSAFGCDAAQGFLYAPAYDARTAEALVRGSGATFAAVRRTG